MKNTIKTTVGFVATSIVFNAFIPGAQAAGLTSGMFSLFLECNNDGTALFLDAESGWQYSQDAIGDMTDGSTYDLTGMGVFQNGSEVFVAIGSNLPQTGAGYDRSIDQIFHGDLFFTPGEGNFQNSMEAGNLYGIHFSDSADSGANAGVGVYQNVAATGVGMQNFGHGTYNNYAAMVDSSSENFYGDLGFNNSYFNGNGTGYNVISGGQKVENDGFQMLTLSDLTAAGLDQNTVGGSEIFGFKFNLDAIVPPEPAPLPKDIGTLKGIAQGYNFDWDGQGWDEDLAEHDTIVAGYQVEAEGYQAQADDYQAQADDHQAQADLYETRRQTANDEATRLKTEEVKPRNSENSLAARNSPGGDANNIVKKERKQRDKILEELSEVNATINETPAKITEATDEFNTLIAERDAIPSEEEAVEIAIANANGTIEQAYAAIEDLTPAKEAWEQYKQDNNWDNLTLQEKLDLQEAYGEDWVELRGDGSPAKQEQELALFSQQIENFEAQVKQDRQAEIAEAEQQINQQQNQIDQLVAKLNNAETRLPELEGDLANFYNTNDLRDRLEQVKTDSVGELAALESDNSLTDAQKAERRAFYESDIARTQTLLDQIDDGNWQASLDSLFDGADQYFQDVLKADAKNSDRLIFNEEGSPAVYTQEDLTVRVPVYDEDGNIVDYTTYIFDKVAVGDQKTVGSEYKRLQAEVKVFNQARKQREQARDDAKNDRDYELAAQQEDLNNRNQALNLKRDALADQQEEIKLKEQLLIEIETKIAQVLDEAIAAEKREQMKASLAAAEVENQREQQLEDRYGIRTLDNSGGIPTSPEEVLMASVPEPSSVFGLAAVMGGLVALRRRFGR